MIVLDTSAAIAAIVGVSPHQALLARIADARGIHAPHLIDVEGFSALRGLVKGGKLSGDRASDARRDLADLAIRRYPLAGIADRVWALRNAMSVYDACFVALAEALDCPLVTCDSRLARSTGHAADIELFEV